MFTDNDELAALVAILTHATQVIMLTSVEGVLVDNAVVPTINHATIKKIVASISDDTSHGGRGGMKSKLHYAGILLEHHIPVVIASARTPGVICDAIDQKVKGTYIQ